MTALRDWIKQNQVLAFYLIVFVISWPAMFLAFFAFRTNVGLQSLFGILATFSPAVIALMISAVAKPARDARRRSSRRAIFVGAWLFSWVVQFLYTWQIHGIGVTPQVIIPSGLVALLPGWLISCAVSRIRGVKELFGTLLRPRGHWLWYLLALFIVPAVQVIGVGITTLVGGEVSGPVTGMSVWPAFVLISLTFLHGFLVSGGVNEETGWRGFVLPRLQARYPVIVAAAVVWLFWALWHLPYDFGRDLPLEIILQNRVLFNFIWSVLMVWLYNRTRGSLLAPAMFHPAMNASGDTLPATDAATVIFILLAAGVFIGDRMWKKLPADSPAVYRYPVAATGPLPARSADLR